MLAEADLPAARTQVFVQEGRVFLESERFDRYSPWRAEGAAPTAPATPPGRLGMVSLLVYDAQYIGEMDNWAATALRMRAHRPPLLTETDARTLRLLIGNTDRHYGNISLVLDGDDWRLSPTYDMLPMLYMPIAGEVVAQELGARGMAATEATRDLWDEARGLALRFWRAVEGEGQISEGFREIARGNSQPITTS